MSKRHRRQNKPRVVVAQPVAGSEAQKREPMKISDTALAYARRKGGGREEILRQVFGLPAFPQGVKPPTMAMDDAGSGLGEVMGWASAQAAILSDGLTFMGFAYLSELMQRPEYRVIAETLAGEMTRKWIRLTSTATEDKAKEEKIKELDAELKRLNVRDRFKRCAELDGGFGRAHLYVDTGDTDKPQELTTPIGDGWNDVSSSKISKEHPVRQFKVVEPVWVYPQSYNSTNPLADDWFKPQQWMVQGTQVHCTRLITFVGREVPDLLKPTYAFGGLSMVQMAKPYVDNWLKTRQGVQDIITSFNVFALMTNLGESLQADDDQVFKRAEMFNRYRDNQGLMILDKDSEDFKNVAVPLGGLSELKAQAQQDMCSVSRTPSIKLIGIQPSGMNASSEGEMRAFYDYTHDWQEHLFRHRLKTVIGFVMLSLWGEVDPDIDFEFIDLWALDEKGEAELEKLKAEKDQIMIDAGVLHPEEVRKRIAAEPDSGYASIDVDDTPDLSLEESEGLEPVGGRPDPEAVLSGEEDEGSEPPPDDGPPPGKRKPKPSAKPAQDETAASPMAMDALPLWEGPLTQPLPPEPLGKRAARRRRGKARRLSIIISGETAAAAKEIDG